MDRCCCRFPIRHHDERFCRRPKQHAENENPALCVINRFQACKGLPDGVGGVTDVNNGERLALNNLEAAGPAHLAQAQSHGGFDFGRGLSRLYAFQPEQEQRDSESGIVELKRAKQPCFECIKIELAEPEIEPLPCRRIARGIRRQCRFRRGQTAA